VRLFLAFLKKEDFVRGNDLKIGKILGVDFSMTGIEPATYELIPVLFITGDTHPDHDSINTFPSTGSGQAASFVWESYPTCL
jgi:hypothetical protein